MALGITPDVAEVDEVVTGLSAIVDKRWLRGAGIVMSVVASGILAAGALWMYA